LNVNDEVKKVLFIINRSSGTGYAPSLETTILNACKAHATGGVIEFTQAPAHATALAAEAAAAGFQSVVAVGGDGTVNEVAKGLLHSPLPMGIIPKGSGNGLARHLGIPLKTELALKCMFSGKVLAMDTFRINGILSLNVSGIGFDGLIANLFGTESRRGLQGYTRLVLNEFRRFPEFEVRIRTENSELTKNAFVVAVANSSQYGNNARIAPAASVCDGQLNISVLKKIPPYRLDFIYQFFSGMIEHSTYCEVIAAQEATIELRVPMYFHIDGEAAGKADRFTIELIPASLRVLAPCDAGKL
jgi:YegS/Rv2252/BmrU family lipid kinase